MDNIPNDASLAGENPIKSAKMLGNNAIELTISDGKKCVLVIASSGTSIPSPSVLDQIFKAIENHDEVLRQLVESKNWHQGDKYRFSDNPDERECWQKRYDSLTELIQQIS